MIEPEFVVAYGNKGRPIGYLPTAQYTTENTRSYIAAMHGSPPISPTYTPGAEYVLDEISPTYYDDDVVAGDIFYQSSTASAYTLPLSQYLKILSASRRKDMCRKLKKADRFQVKHGTLKDLSTAWNAWMTDIWDQRGDRFSRPYDVYLEMTLNWLKVMRRSPRASLRIEKYLLNSQMVGVNCCVVHHYQGQIHCDDYLCWYNPDLASGLGVTSAVRNLTNPDMQGFRYNLGTAGVNDRVFSGHEYKLAIIPEELRLTQAVFYYPETDNQ